MSSRWFAEYLRTTFNWAEDEDAFIAGFTEEPLKFLAFLMFVKSRKEFDEPMDAVVYGAMLSIGFATFNFEYVYVYDFEVDPLTVAMFRAFTAVPLHICCGIIMGYFIALDMQTISFIIRGCECSATHATYNFIDEVAPTFIFILFIVSLSFCSTRVRKTQIKIT